MLSVGPDIEHRRYRAVTLPEGVAGPEPRTPGSIGCSGTFGAHGSRASTSATLGGCGLAES